MLESKKLHQGESYEEVIRRLLEFEDIPSMEEMFKVCDRKKQKRKFSTKEIIEMTHEWRA